MNNENIFSKILGITEDDEVQVEEIEEDPYDEEDHYVDPWWQHLINATKVCIENELTELQRKYILLYYKDGWTMEEIAALKGTTHQKVSNVLRAGERNLRKFLRYAHPNLLYLSENFEEPVKHENRRDSYIMNN